MQALLASKPLIRKRMSKRFLNEIKPIIESMRSIMHQSGHKEQQQPTKVEANHIRIKKELQKEDALRRKKMVRLEHRK